MRARSACWTVLAASMIAASPAVADTDGHATFGAQAWSQTAPEAKYREFRDLPHGFFLESFLLRDRKGDWASTLYGSNAGRADGVYGLMLARGASLRVDAKYQEIPHLFSQVARSPYTEVSPGVFLLPDSLQRTNQEYPASYNLTMTDLLAVADGVPLATRTDISQVRLRSRPMTGWRFELKGQERQRTGHQAMGATFGTSHVVELPVPVSQRTLDGDAIVNYERGSVRLQAIAGVSQFQNDVNTLIWDNPKRWTNDTTRTNAARGPTQGRIDLPPDNNVVRGSMAFGMRLPRASMFSATLGLSEGRQNDAFVPYTINALLPQSRLDSLPAASLDGKMRTVTQDYRLTGRPLDRVWGVLRYHDDQITSKTPTYLFTGLSTTDVSWTASPTENTPFGSGNAVLGTDVNVNLSSWADLSLLAEHRRRTRTDREVEGDKENVLGGNVQLHPGDDLSLTASARYGDRKEDAFSTQFMTDSGDKAALRRYDVAHRQQAIAQSTLEYSIGPRLQTTVDYTFNRSKYPDTDLGLQYSEENLIIGDGTYKATDRIDLSLGYGYDKLDTRQKGLQSGTPTTEWWANLRDQTVFVYSNDSWWAMSRKLRFSGDYTFSRAFGTYDLTNNPLSPSIPVAQDLPSTLYRRHELLLESLWRLQPNYDLSARFYYENFHVDDFATQNIPLLGITGTGATAIYLGDSMQSYVAHRYAVVMSRRF